VRAAAAAVPKSAASAASLESQVSD